MKPSSENILCPVCFFVVCLSGLLLAGCVGDGNGSGGGNGNGGVVGITSHSVSTSAGAHGAVSPTSATVAEGDSTSFTVTPDSGYGIDSVSGCGGSLSGNTYTTGAIREDCTVNASFAAVLPAVRIADASVVEGNSGTTTLNFTISLSAQANGDVTVDYATSDGTATAGSDYLAASGTLTINSGTTSNTVGVTVNGDTSAERDETLTLTLSNVSANASLGTASATGTIVNDETVAGSLNDTGITLCGDYSYISGTTTHNNHLDCRAVGASATAAGSDSEGDPVPAGQDAHFGRDVTANDDSDGHAGFSFRKIDSTGNPLPASATSWDCVRDNVTGLMWEVKRNDSGLRDKGWTYTWYDSDSAANGGSAGTANGGSCYDAAHCDTEKFVAQVNGNGGICGYSDWRMPKPEELLSIADMSTTSPAIDSGYFPNTQSFEYWSTSTISTTPGEALNIGFGHGSDFPYGKDHASYVRLVRDSR